MPRGDPIPAIDRVRARLDTSAGPFGCWPYQGAVNKKDGNGYGVVTIWTDGKQRVEYVHRVVLAEALGRALEPGEEACHHCDFKLCCNPSHLYAGSHAENMRDALRRGRLLSGDRCPWTKISDTDRALIARSSLSNSELAQQFGVSESTIRRNREKAGRNGAV